MFEVIKTPELAVVVCLVGNWVGVWVWVWVWVLQSLGKSIADRTCCVCYFVFFWNKKAIHISLHMDFRVD